MASSNAARIVKALLSAAQNLLGAFSTTMLRLGYLIDILGAH